MLRQSIASLSRTLGSAAKSSSPSSFSARVAASKRALSSARSASPAATLLSTPAAAASSSAALKASALPQHSQGVKAVIPVDSEALKLVWGDELAADYHHLWLRDNCHCAACRHPVTKQKLLDTPSIPLDIKPTTVQVNGDGNVEIVWSHEGHKSVYQAEWLRTNVYSLPGIPAPSTAIPMSRMVLWDQAAIEPRVPVVEYSELANDDKGVLKWLTLLERFGVAVVRGTPVEKNQVMEMAKRIAHVKETSYGPLFDVLNEPRPGAHLAFTGVELKHHTDMNYMEKSPGIQLLHCLRADAVGGESVFVDGFYLAEWLRKTDPAAFHVLSSTDVGFAIRNGDFTYLNYLPIICLDRNRHVSEVHVNNRTMQPMIIHPDLVVPFYSAFKLLNDKMRERATELRLDMRPGDVVAFNNRRVLHGRTSFDPSSGTRHLQGCYVDMEEFKSRLSFLREKHGDNKF